MEFYVNDEKIDVSLENEKTIGDVLKSFEIMCEENQAAVIGIKINGEQITAETFDEIAKKTLTPELKFELNIVTKKAVFESFKELASLFEQLAQEMKEIPVMLQTGRDKEANYSIKKLADSIESFSHIATLASLFENFTEIIIDGISFKEFFENFSPVLQDFEQMLNSNDTVSIGDIAEYEICPRLIAISEALKSKIN